MTVATLIFVSAAVTLVVVLALRGVRRPSAVNHRGVRLPLILGIALEAGSVASAASLWIIAVPSGAGIRTLVAAGIVFLAGLIDDVLPPGPRGLRGHFRALAGGHMTTGILKLLVTVVASIVVVAVLPRGPFPVQLAGVVTVAGSTNLWNGLDVAPGRAIKAFLVAGAGVLLAGVSVVASPIVAAVFAAAIVAFPFDLRERAMLGDGGSNLLGFTAGVGLHLVLPPGGLFVAAAVIVVLNLVAETVTLTRFIEAVAPLRWADGLGRTGAGT